jgi:hypothetical protein
MKDLIVNALLASMLSSFIVSDKPSFTSSRSNEIPATVLWAWERSEDLSFIDPHTTAVAYYAGIIYLRGESARIHPRLNPLKLPQGAVVIPVFRIEELGSTGKEPKAAAIAKANEIICEYVKRHASPAVQVDYDAGVNSRKAYLQLLRALHNTLPKNTMLSVTALASWCLDDRWLAQAPVDEAVAMLFTMGADSGEVLSRLEKMKLNAGAGEQSVGVAGYERKTNFALRRLKLGRAYRRVYLFSDRRWTREDYAKACEVVMWN